VLVGANPANPTGAETDMPDADDGGGVAAEHAARPQMMPTTHVTLTRNRGRTIARADNPHPGSI
jgi:hypothetical protein